MGYRIGSFNMYKFTAYQSDEEIRKDISKIADIILEEGFDIIAMQEVFSPIAVKRLINILGMGWKYVWAQPKARTYQAAEGYAYIWNARRFGLVKTQTPYGNRIFEPKIYNQYALDKNKGQISLERNPYYARFTPNGLPGGSFFEIRLINAHIMYKSSAEQMNLSDNLLRKNEFQILAENIYPKISDKRYGDNMPAYTILLGDFNLNLCRQYTKAPYLEEIIEISDNGSWTKRIVTVQDELSTVKNKINEEQGYASNYDHFTYDAERFSVIKTKTSRIDAVNKYYGGDFQKYKKEISDHVPVAFDLYMN